MTGYTDDDVTAALRHMDLHTHFDVLDDGKHLEEVIIETLRAVAPVIAARTFDYACDNLPPTFPRMWLREQADAARAERVNP